MAFVLFIIVFSPAVLDALKFNHRWRQCPACLLEESQTERETGLEGRTSVEWEGERMMGD